MRTSRWLFLVVALTAVGAGGFYLRAKAQGGHRAVPPTEESAVWTPPKTSLPKEVVDAAEFMLRHGLGDPRDGKLVKAKVMLGNSWNGGGEGELVGWLLPKGNKLVGIDGLVYEPKSIVGETDLATALKPAQESAQYVMMDRGGTPIWPILLLIHGDVAAAESSYKQPPNQSGPGEIFRMFTNGFLVSRFHYAVEAHMRGDDQLALRESTGLRRDWKAYEDEATKQLGPTWVTTHSREGERQIYSFLRPVEALYADSLRRCSAPRSPIDWIAYKKLSSKDRVAVLIDHLDDVAARQWGQPGGVNVFDDQIVQLLVAEGKEAGGPLLDTMENDTRLTRSVGFGRDFFPDRYLLSTKDAAYGAFRVLMQVDEFGGYGKPIDVAALRAYWEANKDLTPAERWMKTLADDSAGQRRWVEAAQRLVEPETVKHIGQWTTTDTHKPNEAEPPMKGEPLRSRTSPSISDLIAKRAKQLAEGLENQGEPQQFEVSDALRMSQVLAKWDAKAALPTLQAVSKLAMDLCTKPHHGYMAGAFARSLAEIVEARYKQGDTAVLDEYVQWIDKPEMENLSEDTARLFIPMVNHRDVPAVRDSARKTFTDPNSRWNLAASAKNMPGWNQVESMIISPILALDPVREAVEKILADKTAIGESWRNGNMVMTSHDNGTTGEGLQDKSADPLAPPPGEKREFRICDNMAKELARRLKGAPAFQPYWPTDVKDKKIKEIIAFLNQNKSDIVSLLSWPYNWKDHPDNFGAR